MDAVLLASFAGEGRRARQALDLGAGVGAVGLCLLYRDRSEHVVFAEADRTLTAMCAANLEDNGWTGRGRATCVDVSLAGALPVAFADLVVCNPPYVSPGRGRAPRVGSGARVGELTFFAEAARRALGARGRACFVYPAPELATLFETLRGAGLEPKRLCFVHASLAKPARVALVLAVPGKRGGLVVTPPFVERAGSQVSPALADLLAPRAALPRRG